MTDILSPAEQRIVTGHKVAHYRELLRMNQQELADALNAAAPNAKPWTADRVHTLERGRTKLPAEWIPILCAVLDCAADDLFSPTLDLRRLATRGRAHMGWMIPTLSDLQKVGVEHTSPVAA